MEQWTHAYYGRTLPDEGVANGGDGGMDELTAIQRIAGSILPILFAVTLHEVAHGWVARELGDRTAEQFGRLSWNPLRHIDPVGTVLVPALSFLLGGIVFGWAKPVPVTWENLRNPRRDMALVALAGPTANLVMLIGWVLLTRLALAGAEVIPFAAFPLIYMGLTGIMINSVLMVLNLLPLPPLDGSRVVSAMLPPRLAARYQGLERYGLVILLVLLASGLLGKVLLPLVGALESLAHVLLGA